MTGARYDLTSGVLALSREPGRDVERARAKRTSFAAIATAVTSGTPRGGVIRVRALQGSIEASDRAFPADGRGDNGSA